MTNVTFRLLDDERGTTLTIIKGGITGHESWYVESLADNYQQGITKGEQVLDFRANFGDNSRSSLTVPAISMRQAVQDLGMASALGFDKAEPGRFPQIALPQANAAETTSREAAPAATAVRRLRR